MPASGGIVARHTPPAPPNEDDIVGAMACAMADTDGYPTADWGPILRNPPDPEPLYWTTMKRYVAEARKIRAAYKAMVAIDPAVRR